MEFINIKVRNSLMQIKDQIFLNITNLVMRNISAAINKGEGNNLDRMNFKSDAGVCADILSSSYVNIADGRFELINTNCLTTTSASINLYNSIFSNEDFPLMNETLSARNLIPTGVAWVKINGIMINQLPTYFSNVTFLSNYLLSEKGGAITYFGDIGEQLYIYLGV